MEFFERAWKSIYWTVAISIALLFAADAYVWVGHDDPLNRILVAGEYGFLAMVIWLIVGATLDGLM